ncbi:hypothetical protein IMY05_C4596000300 [Salix suchowensis]|nr:hypothetical protein IMY05_C4596000300 [Salix suchowensis]
MLQTRTQKPQELKLKVKFAGGSGMKFQFLDVRQPVGGVEDKIGDPFGVYVRTPILFSDGGLGSRKVTVFRTASGRRDSVVFHQWGLYGGRKEGHSLNSSSIASVETDIVEETVHPADWEKFIWLRQEGQDMPPYFWGKFCSRHRSNVATLRLQFKGPAVETTGAVGCQVRPARGCVELVEVILDIVFKASLLTTDEELDRLLPLPTPLGVSRIAYLYSAARLLYLRLVNTGLG